MLLGRSASWVRRVGQTFFIVLVCLSWSFVNTSVQAQQLTADQQADLLLDSARRAYNEKNYPFASQKFREYLTKYAGNKNSPAARYGLALTLLEGPERDYVQANEQLAQLAGLKDFPELPFVFYYHGISQRGLGLRELQQASAKPAEAANFQQRAKERFEEGAKHLTTALPLFVSQVQPIPEKAKEVPSTVEWAARVRCDLAELQIRVQKAKEAQATVAEFTQEKSPLARSKYLELGLYYHGYASFLLKDQPAAVKSLSFLAPFTDPVVGLHARYLLARVHHAEGERAEALHHYETLLAEYTKQKAEAPQLLRQQAEKLKTQPEEKARLEALAQGPPPDHVLRASFYAGALLYENGRFGEAKDRLQAFLLTNPPAPLLAETQLRIGFCLVQAKQAAEALKILQPLAEKEAKLADQAHFWIGKAQVQLADPANAPAYEQALKTALESFRRAVDRNRQLNPQDAETKSRLGEILLDWAETQQLAKQFKEAANTYGTVLNEKLLVDRVEEIAQRQVSALHLAGDYVESDKAVERFKQAYPKSTLLPPVLFRHAENAYFQLLAAEKNTNAQERAVQLPKLQDETLKRYQQLVEKYPEYPQVSLAKYGVALVYYRKSDLEKTKETLLSIPAPDRVGELALVPYLLADCWLRLAPTKADDALTAGQLEEALKSAAEQLDSFIGSQPKAVQTPDAFLKLGSCQQRQATLLAQVPDRNKQLDVARATYDKLLQQFPQAPQAGQAHLERAKTFALQGNLDQAINDLRKFTEAPWKNASVAPLGVLQLASYQRARGRAQEGADGLAKARTEHEPALLKDPARVAWVPLLQYHQGVCLREANKLPEARAQFEAVVKQFPNSPEAVEAGLRSAQVAKDQGLLKIEAARKQLATGGLKPEQMSAAQKELEAGYTFLRDASKNLEAQAETYKTNKTAVEARQRLLYDSAWTCRYLADTELAATREKLQQALLQKQKDELTKTLPAGRVLPQLPTPIVPIASIPVQPYEQKARSAYQALIATYPDSALALEARFELAELFSERNEHDAAVKLLKEALDKEPTVELTEKVKLRIGVALAQKGDHKEALAQYQTVLNNAKSLLLPHALLRAAESQCLVGDYEQAVKLLTVIQTRADFHNVAQVSDRAFLRLGHALAELKKWDESRVAHERVLGFGNSPWVFEARYGIGWAQQQAKRYEEAVAAYAQVVSGTATEIAAKAQLQIGLCRLEQKKYPEAASALLVVPFTYDYPEWSAVALCEAARTFVELKQPDQASKLLERVVRDHGDSKWAGIAKERLQALKASKSE